jgi:four helix bundle protein
MMGENSKWSIAYRRWPIALTARKKQTKKAKMAFKFENLRVWHSALENTVAIYDLSKKFPQDERFGLISQINRAADSVCLNIAEGSQGSTDKQFSNFLGIAIRSAIEVVSCLFVAKAKSMIDANDFQEHYLRMEGLIKMIQALRNSLKNE